MAVVFLEVDVLVCGWIYMALLYFLALPLILLRREYCLVVS